MTTIKIKGMNCQHCVNATKKALESIDGVTGVSIDLAKGEATFSGDVDHQVIVNAISKIGFEVIQ